MVARLKVDPADLWMSADHLAMHSADLRAAHAEADADIEATEAGWAGESASAMQLKMAEWQEFTDRICAVLDNHQTLFRLAGNRYQVSDGDRAQAIDRVEEK
jgi:WXG100 family type VII secretion target